MQAKISYRYAVAGLLLWTTILGCEPVSDARNNGESPALEGKQVSLQANSSSNTSMASRAPQNAATRGDRSAFPQRTDKSILIASFNIKAFGTSKMEDKFVMGRIAEVIRQFDVIAIQEIRSTDQRLIPRLLDFVNADGMQYDYLLGPRLGRTSSKEQYAYLYDTTRIIADPNASYTVNDGHPGAGSKQEIGVDGLPDLLHREPLVARFVVRVMPNPFTFTLVNIHTDPDEVAYELNVLDDVYKQVCNYEYSQANEDDVILLGDLNAAPEKFGELAIPGLRPAIAKQFSNVRETALYDNLLIDSQRTNEFTGRSGVFSLKEFFNLNLTDAERLSDHNPIWAEFRIQEQISNAQVANQFGGVVR